MILINLYCAISLDLDRSNDFIRSRELHLDTPDHFHFLHDAMHSRIGDWIYLYVRNYSF